MEIGTQRLEAQWPKQCAACNRTYMPEPFYGHLEWKKLPLKGPYVNAFGTHELRNCLCGGTMMVTLEFSSTTVVFSQITGPKWNDWADHPIDTSKAPLKEAIAKILQTSVSNIQVKVEPDGVESVYLDGRLSGWIYTDNEPTTN